MAAAAVRYWAPETRGGEVKSSRREGHTWVRKGICRLRRRGGELRVASVANG